jgi:hypothetical protein
VDRLISELPLKDRITIANMTPDRLKWFHSSPGSHLGLIFRVWTGSDSLMGSCRLKSGRQDLQTNDAALVIVDALWERLQETHRLRAVR